MLLSRPWQMCDGVFGCVWLLSFSGKRQCISGTDALSWVTVVVYEAVY